MAGEAERVEAYLATVKRLEPDIAMIDHDAAMASIAISLRRIADALEGDKTNIGLIQAILMCEPKP